MKRIELPSLEEETSPMLTTTLHIFADILQRLVDAGATLEVDTTIYEDEFIDEDEEGNEVLFEAGPAEILAMIEEKIEVDETGLSLIVDDGLEVEDVDNDFFIVTYSLFKTRTRLFCELITELADAGHTIQAKVNEEDIRILELEYQDTGDVRALYVPFEKPLLEPAKEEEPYLVIEDFLSSRADLIVSYNEEEAQSRLYSSRFEEDEVDAFDLYRSTFLPRIRAARENGEVPGLLF